MHRHRRLTDKSKLFGKHVWRAHSHPFLDGGQGENLCSIYNSLHHSILHEPKELESVDSGRHATHSTTGNDDGIANPPGTGQGNEGTDASDEVPPHQLCLYSNPVAAFAAYDEGPDEGPALCNTNRTVTRLSSPGYDNSSKPRADAGSSSTTPSKRLFTWTNLFHSTQTAGLEAPCLNAGLCATGYTTPLLRLENRRRRKLQQRIQLNLTVWKKHQGLTRLPPRNTCRPRYLNSMCPAGAALFHPAAPRLLDYATHGSPVDTGAPWTTQTIVAALRRGPHVSALAPDAIRQFDVEIAEKVAAGHARLVTWNSIQACPPKQLKISPIAMVPPQIAR